MDVALVVRLRCKRWMKMAMRVRRLKMMSTRMKMKATMTTDTGANSRKAPQRRSRRWEADETHCTAPLQGHDRERSVWKEKRHFKTKYNINKCFEFIIQLMPWFILEL